MSPYDDAIPSARAADLGLLLRDFLARDPPLLDATIIDSRGVWQYVFSQQGDGAYRVSETYAPSAVLHASGRGSRSSIDVYFRDNTWASMAYLPSGLGTAPAHATWLEGTYARIATLR